MLPKPFLVLAAALALTFCAGPAPETPAVRNLILVIADGMGPQQISLAVLYARYAPGSAVPDRTLHLERLMREGVTGWMTTEPQAALVPDSASSASQLATGKPALSETLGLDAEGNPAETILERARRAGKATGLVTDTRLTHATPAAFASHQPHRSLENEIAEDILEGEPDVLLGGGLRHWLPRSSGDPQSPAHRELRSRIPDHISLDSRRGDEKDLILRAEEQGYELVFAREELERTAAAKILGLFHSTGLPDGIAVSRSLQDPGRRIPTLRELTRKSLETLSRGENGFFLMVEGGQIDWAAHDNDAGRMLHELLHFDDALGEISTWVKGRTDTLLVVTADHETGSFGFSYSAVPLPEPQPLPGAAFRERPFKPDFNFGSYEVLDRIYDQKLSFDEIFRRFDALPAGEQTAESLMRLVNQHLDFPITLEQAGAILETEPNPFHSPGHPYLAQERVPKIADFKEFHAYGSEGRKNLLARTLAARQQIVWGTATHTTTPVVLIAYGPREVASRFGGLLHSTEVGRLLFEALGFEPR